MITWLFSQIPLWVYVTGALLTVGALFYFFSPILVPLWNVTPRWVKVALGFVAALFSAYVLGMNKAARAAKERQKQLDQQAETHREEIHREVENLSPDDLNKRFDKWVR